MTRAPYYADDLVSLYLGDCREIGAELGAWLEADVLVTDPPYGLARSTGEFSNAHQPRVETIEGDGSPAVRDEVLSLWGGRPALVFGSWRVPRPLDVRHRLIWHKIASLPGRRSHPWYSAEEEIYVLGAGFTGKPEQNVLRTHNRQDGSSGEVFKVGHPYPKPVALMGRLIAKCPPGVIADPFAGSGSTLLAAKQLGRRSIGVEVEERYCEIAAKRLAQEVLDFGESA